MGGMAGARLPSRCSSAVLAASWCRKIRNHPPVVNLMRTSAPRAFIHFIHFILSAIVEIMCPAASLQDTQYIVAAGLY